MKTSAKAFDCVEFQHAAGRAIAEETGGMSAEELAAYYDRLYEAMVKRQEELRRKTGWHERQQTQPRTPGE